MHRIAISLRFIATGKGWRYTLGGILIQQLSSTDIEVSSFSKRCFAELREIYIYGVMESDQAELMKHPVNKRNFFSKSSNTALDDLILTPKRGFKEEYNLNPGEQQRTVMNYGDYKKS